jgi:hypothetical protein
MRNTILLFLAMALFSCAGEEEVTEEGTISGPNNLLPYWDVDVVAKTYKRDTLANWGEFQLDSLISGLNERNENIKLEKSGSGHDTIFLTIKDAYYLTAELGSSGAEQYIASVVLNLTSVEGVNYISLDFRPGDHASPGVFGKELISGFKEIP